MKTYILITSILWNIAFLIAIVFAVKEFVADRIRRRRKNEDAHCGCAMCENWDND